MKKGDQVMSRELNEADEGWAYDLALAVREAVRAPDMWAAGAGVALAVAAELGVDREAMERRLREVMNVPAPKTIGAEG